MLQIDWLVSALSIAYGVAVIAWQVLRLAAGDRWWWLGMANSASLALFLPLAVLVPLALLGRNHIALAALVAPLAIAIAVYGRFYLPRPSGAGADTGRALRVMSLNVLYVNDDGAAIQALAGAEDADLLCLQEVNPRLAADLETRLAGAYPYRRLLPEEGTSGLGIFSRYPLNGGGEIPDPARETGWKHGALAATLDFEGQQVLVLNVHAISSWPDLSKEGRAIFERSFRMRDAQARIWRQRVARHRGPAIVAGDFNQTDQSVAYRLLSAELKDAHLHVGRGLGHTYPAIAARWHGLPLPRRMLRLDYVFYTDDWIAGDARVGGWDGQSDHLPLFATLRLR